jgi:uncharacterized protein (TIGR01777 family)
VKVFITGGTGFVGKTLSAELALRGHAVTVLTRRETPPGGGHQGVTYVRADPMLAGDWQRTAAGHDALVNLAGRSIFARWTSAVKRQIRESRAQITDNIVEAVALSGRKGISLINASAVGYYGFRGDEVVDETGGQGSDFLATVAADWERAALEAAGHGARVALCRFGIVLGRKGGALAQMLKTYKHLPIGPLGSGKQWFSWIHERDLTSVLIFLLENPALSGPVNCSSPKPVRNRDFVRTLAEALGRRVLPVGVPSLALGIALGEFGKILLEGQRVVPRKLLDAGFEFSFPSVDSALKDLLGPD